MARLPTLPLPICLGSTRKNLNVSRN
ncbi:hypothetical protein YPPY88_4638, partial [Yersinia pestis PY-88]